ncbi:MAG TPA: hypothetical protein VMH02_04025 [Verrucomicrobiae bacterium]|nr:hypothetical protein [Verrucomicrobiae bacterium]
MKRFALTGALLLGGALALPSMPASVRSAAAATPTPVALQYDQIIRTIVPPATPPAPGSFQTDYAAIMSAASASGSPQGASSPPPHRGLGGLLGAVMGGQPPGGPGGDQSGGYGAAMSRMAEMRAGTLTRLTYYEGWIRTEEPALQTATIEKCQSHQFITLDLAKKTYAIANTAAPCPPRPMGPMGGPMRGGTGEEAAPGTSDLTLTSNETSLGPLEIDGIPTTGYNNDLSMATTNATGSCRNGQMGMTMERYVSKIAVPRAVCPLPRGTSPENPASMASRGGCKPTMHLHGSPSAAFGEMDRLIMYSKMAMSGGGDQSRMGGFSFVTERGNVKWLSGAAADALFTIPPGFTAAQ